VIDYHKRGWSEKSYFKFDGTVFDAKGLKVYTLDGKWN